MSDWLLYDAWERANRRTHEPPEMRERSQVRYPSAGRRLLPQPHIRPVLSALRAEARDREEEEVNQETRDAVREGCQRSAGIILPMIFDTLGAPWSLIDVGAGEGWWAMAARDLGVEDYVHAVDVEPRVTDFEIANPGIGVEAWDAEARQPLPLHDYGGQPAERWSIALCLEVAEHLTPEAGDHLVAELCRVADEIIWSAAIPGQGGDGHINEQWPAYWSERFNLHGFMLDDPWRLDLWHADVEPWYAQNLLLAYRVGRPGMQSAPYPPLALVHPTTWAHHRGVPAPGG